MNCTFGYNSGLPTWFTRTGVVVIPKEEIPNVLEFAGAGTNSVSPLIASGGNFPSSAMAAVKVTNVRGLRTWFSST